MIRKREFGDREDFALPLALYCENCRMHFSKGVVFPNAFRVGPQVHLACKSCDAQIKLKVGLSVTVISGAEINTVLRDKRRPKLDPETSAITREEVKENPFCKIEMEENDKRKARNRVEELHLLKMRREERSKDDYEMNARMRKKMRRERRKDKARKKVAKD